MKILVAFCGAGGSSMGYHLGGFDEVTGVDIFPQAEYPFNYLLEDAVTVLSDQNFVKQFDLVHASPPCQAYCTLTNGTNGGNAGKHPELIDVVRPLLVASGVPYVIENVPGAPIRKDLLLCGEMFGLGVIRHRYFELGNWKAKQPEHIAHRGKVRGWNHGVYSDGPYLAVYGAGGGKGSLAEWQAAMQIPWMTVRKSLAEAIPPPYTKYIAEQFLIK